MLAVPQRMMAAMPLYLFGFRRLPASSSGDPRALKSACLGRRCRRNAVSTKPAADTAAKGQSAAGFGALPARRSDVAAMIRTAIALPAALTRIGTV